jgi:hypothetical protein
MLCPSFIQIILQYKITDPSRFLALPLLIGLRVAGFGQVASHSATKQTVLSATAAADSLLIVERLWMEKEY